MTYTADPRIDAYIDALPRWQQAICREVRALIPADPEVTAPKAKALGLQGDAAPSHTIKT